MRVKAISWVGMKTTAYREMREFFAVVAGLPVEEESGDFTAFRLPSGDKLEVFGPEGPQAPGQFRPNEVVASLLVDDLDGAVAELRSAGIEIIGDREEGASGYAWQHFRAPDGKIFELVVDPAHP